MDQNSQSIVWSITQAPFGLLGQFTIKMHFIFQKGDDNSEIEHKTC